MYSKLQYRYYFIRSMCSLIKQQLNLHRTGSKKAEINAMHDQLRAHLKDILQQQEKPEKKRPGWPPFKSKDTIDCHLILGPPDSGKSTLLTQSGLPTQSHTATSHIWPDVCTFWFYQDTIFIEVAPELLETNNVTANAHWQAILQLLCTMPNGCHLASVLTTYRCTGLAEHTPPYLDAITQRLRQLQTNFQSVPQLLVLTHCDSIAGFIEFFAELDTEQQQQSWYIERTNTHTGTMADWQKQFNQLTNCLQRQLITNLHHEYTLAKRHKIFQFPLQMGALRDKLWPCIEKWQPEFVYFTSSAQRCLPQHYTMNWLTEQAVHLPATQNKQIPMLAYGEKSLFTQQLMQNPLLRQQTSTRPSQLKQYARSHTQASSLDRPAGKGVVQLFIGLVALASLLLAFSWYDNYHVLKKLLPGIHVLTTDGITTPRTLNQLHNKLYTLHHATRWLRKTHLELATSQKIQGQLQNYYDIQFTHLLFSQLQQRLYSILFSTQTPSLTDQYHALQIYHVIAQHRSVPPATIAWLKSQNTLPLIQALSGDINQWLQKQSDHMLLDPAQLDEQIAQLQQQRDNGTLILQLLRKQYQLDHLPSLSDTPHSFYTRQQLMRVFFDIIPQYCQQWLDQDQLFSQQAMPYPTLVSKTRLAYLDAYRQTWQHFLQQSMPNLIDLKKAPNITLEAYRNSLILWQNNQQATLEKRLKIAAFNTEPITRQIANHTIGSQDWAADYQNTRQLTEIMTQMVASAIKQLNTILNQPHPQETTFNLSLAYAKYDTNNALLKEWWKIQDKVAQLPPSLVIFPKQLAHTHWNLLFTQAQQHVNQVWHTLIYPAYKNKLENQYPLFDSAKDLPLTQFNYFFAPQGLIERFFQYYLKPFIQIKQFNWQWKLFDGLTLAHDKETLQLFLRAHLISKMFFTHSPHHAAFNVSLQFQNTNKTTQPISFQIGEKSVVLSGQEDPKPITVQWPNNSTPIRIKWTNNQTYRERQLEWTGPWALLRFIDQAKNGQKLLYGQRYNLALPLGYSQLPLILMSDQVVHPFVSGILETFRCPEHLFQE